jgi:hypothetical protein
MASQEEFRVISRHECYQYAEFFETSPQSSQWTNSRFDGESKQSSRAKIHVNKLANNNKQTSQQSIKRISTHSTHHIGSIQRAKGTIRQCARVTGLRLLDTAITTTGTCKHTIIHTHRRSQGSLVSSRGKQEISIISIHTIISISIVIARV